MAETPDNPATNHDDPPPILDYRGPGERWRPEPRIPNPAAMRSVQCGLGWIGLVPLVIIALALPESVGVVILICIALAWLLLVIGAFSFGIVGSRRSQEPNVGGHIAAIIGILLGVAGIIMGALGTFAVLAVIGLRGPAGEVNRLYCHTHLGMIGQACARYSNNNAGKFPPDFGAILEDATPGYFICTASGDTPATGPTTQAILADFAKPGRCSYIYLGAGLTTATPGNTPIACDRAENHAGKGIHVLYADGTITWLGKQKAEAFFADLPSTAQHPATPP